ncbi:pilus assembly protein [Rhodopseudomonas sp. P1]|uniref:TadE/TadG family type IV pilus assembly protein n=1 Tax=Rhodopseudomonas sp. P1 TaxID=3434357 RepID=UPI0031FC8677
MRSSFQRLVFVRSLVLLRRLQRDRRGVAAIEFAIIVPVMLVMFLATVEVTSGIAVDRKVTLVARTLSDLVSQSTSVTDNDLKNVFAASYGVLTPYSATPVKATITEVFVNKNQVATVQWSKTGTVTQSGSSATATVTNSTRQAGDTITIPDGLKVANTYLIFSEVSYQYQPTVAYFIPQAGISLADQSYTRPRQSLCVLYGTTVCPTN